MKLLLPALVVVSSLSSAPAPKTFTGVITDEMCAKGDHSGMKMGPNDAECTKLCVMFHDSAYVLYDGKNSYTLSDKKLAEKFAGQKAKVTGTLDAKMKSIHVDAITAAK